jgi:hypothetical protein
MFQASTNGTAKPSWENRQWQPRLSLHVLSDQIHTKPQTLGLSRRSAPQSASVARGWDESAPNCPSSRPSPSHGFSLGQSPSGQIIRPTRPWRGQRSGDGRIVHLYWGQKNQNIVITIVDRVTRCYLSFQVVWQRTQTAIQEMVD